MTHLKATQVHIKSEGCGAKTTVALDGHRLRNVRALRFEVGVGPKPSLLTLELVALDVTIEGSADVRLAKPESAAPEPTGVLVPSEYTEGLLTLLNSPGMMLTRNGPMPLHVGPAPSPVADPALDMSGEDMMPTEEG